MTLPTATSSTRPGSSLPQPPGASGTAVPGRARWPAHPALQACGRAGPPLAAAAAPRSRNLHPDERPWVGVARWPDAGPAAAGDAAQAAYGRSFAAATELAAQDIAAGRLADLAAVWRRATQWRVRQLPAGQAGLRGPMTRRRAAHALNTPFFHTPLNGRYRYVIERMLASPGVERQAGYGGDAGVDLLELVTRTQLRGRDVELTTVQLPTRAGSDPLEIVSEGRWLQPLIVHSHPGLLDDILAHAQELACGLAPSMALPARLEQLGALHWWLAQAMPDERGSAAKAEFCVRAYAGAAGVALPPFRAGVVPDIEAFLTPLQAYRTGYATYFERLPTT
jgi:avirulence protein